MRDADDKAIETVADDDLPVVARMVVEIRSDGSRTVAKGAYEDVLQGERVTLQAAGASPAELAATLLRSMVKLPFATTPVQRLRKVVKGLLPSR